MGSLTRVPCLKFTNDFGTAGLQRTALAGDYFVRLVEEFHTLADAGVQPQGVELPENPLFLGRFNMPSAHFFVTGVFLFYRITIIILYSKYNFSDILSSSW